MTNGKLTFCVRPPVTLDVAIPDTERELQWGLQSYERLNMREGMLFLSREYPREDVIAMWIASVPFPLSMTWFDKDWKVIAIEEWVEPHDKLTYGADFKAIAIVESHADFPRKYGIRIGTRAVPQLG